MTDKVIGLIISVLIWLFMTGMIVTTMGVLYSAAQIFLYITEQL